jgi:hypothetical protein
MVSDQLLVDPAQMQTHAGRVGQVADLARQARQAAAGMNLGGGAFGIMCNFLVTPLQLLSAPAIGFLDRVAESVEATGEAFNTAAGMFDQAEADSVADIERELSGLR